MLLVVQESKCVLCMQRSGDARGNCLTVRPLANCSTKECEKYRHLKYVKSSVEKKQVSKKLNSTHFKEYFLLLMC